MPNIPEFTTRPELAGTFGMVASTHWLASAAGMAVLEKGGNAFDAAAGAGFVLQVVEPHLCGPGGEVPVIGYDARRGGLWLALDASPMLPSPRRGARIEACGPRPSPDEACGPQPSFAERGQGRCDVVRGICVPGVGYGGA